MSKSEERFREAFHRLRDGKPTTLPNGSEVTQKNISLEAGCGPDSLKKSRHPRLIAEIKSWITQRDLLSAQTKAKPQQKERLAKESTADRMRYLEAQRDLLASKLVEADAKILELTSEVLRLQSLKNI